MNRTVNLDLVKIKEELECSPWLSYNINSTEDVIARRRSCWSVHGARLIEFDLKEAKGKPLDQSRKSEKFATLSRALSRALSFQFFLAEACARSDAPKQGVKLNTGFHNYGNSQMKTKSSVLCRIYRVTLPAIVLTNSTLIELVIISTASTNTLRVLISFHWHAQYLISEKEYLTFFEYHWRTQAHLIGSLRNSTAFAFEKQRKCICKL